MLDIEQGAGDAVTVTMSGLGCVVGWPLLSHCWFFMDTQF